MVSALGGNVNWDLKMMLITERCLLHIDVIMRV